MTRRETLLSLAAELRQPPSDGRVVAILAEATSIVGNRSKAYTEGVLRFYDGELTLNELSFVLTNYAFQYLPK